MAIADTLAAAKGDKALSKAPVLRRLMLRSAVFGVLGSIVFVPVLIYSLSEVGSIDAYYDARLTTVKQVATIATVISAAVFGWVLVRALLLSRARAASDLPATQILLAQLKTALTGMLIVSLASWISMAAVAKSLFGDDFSVAQMWQGLFAIAVVVIWRVEASRAQVEVRQLAEDPLNHAGVSAEAVL